MAAQLAGRYIQGRFQPDKSIDLVDEACAGLRMQQVQLVLSVQIDSNLVVQLQESRPDELEKVAREVALLRMEETSVAREEGQEDRLAALRAKIAEKESIAQQLDSEWNREKKQLEQIKNRKRDVAAARTELDKAQRAGDWARASELK